MPKVVTINDITGTTPYNIFLCDNPVTLCVYIGTTSTTPYSFDVPSVLVNQKITLLKLRITMGVLTKQLYHKIYELSIYILYK